jgi:hypothetical protein
MRAILALGLLITLCASANAASAHHFKLREGHLRPVQTCYRSHAAVRGSRMIKQIELACNG